MNKKIFEQYAQLEQQRRAIEVVQKDLKAKMLDEMDSLNVDAVNIDLGSFNVVKRKEWTYSNKVIAQEEMLKIMKADEEADGSAEFEETKGIRFNPKKLSS